MKTRSMWMVAAMLPTLLLAACKKPDVPSPTVPEPKAEANATAPNAPGTTTNYETPAGPPKQ